MAPVTLQSQHVVAIVIRVRCTRDVDVIYYTAACICVYRITGIFYVMLIVTHFYEFYKSVKTICVNFHRGKKMPHVKHVNFLHRTHKSNVHDFQLSP